MTTRRIILIIVFIGLLVAGIVAGARLRRSNPTPLSDTTLIVATTTFPIYDYTRAITKNLPHIRVAPLAPFNIGPHDYSPTPDTGALVSMADIVIINGLGLDTYANKLIEANGKPGVVVVDSSKNANIITGGKNEEGEEQTFDPHLWLDPTNARQQVDNITAALVQADPANRETLLANATAYRQELTDLDQAYMQELGAVIQKDFVSFHSAFRYLARRYNINQVAVIDPAPGTDPSPQQLITVINTIRQKNIKVIFSEPQFSPKIVEAIAKDLQIEVRSLDPIETATGNENYLTIMRRNLDSLVKALSVNS